MSTFLKPTVIANTALGLLSRETGLASLVWRDAVGDFRGAANDTISIRVPAYAAARTRALRSGSTRTRDEVHERKVDVSLSTGVYKDIVISDELLSLDIADFGTQVLNPVMAGIARAMEDELVTEMTGATYQNEIAFSYSTGDPYADIAVEARRLLNAANVPTAGRRLVVGSSIEAALLTSDKLVKASDSGSTATLREGAVGRIAGFDVYTSPAIDPDEAYAFHQTAYCMVSRAPLAPAGAPYSASASFDGFAMRVVRVLDSATIEDVLAVDSWVGVNIVTDNGTMSGDVFTPSEDPDNGSELFVRSVKVTASS